MEQIVLEGICKGFRIAKRPPGLLGAVKGAFVREYTDVKALDNVEFAIGEGELVGYIGPNGAGKSTTVKVMSGILVPDAGNCQIMGRVPWKQRTAHVACIGVVFGQRSQLWWDVPVLDSFELLRDIYNVKQSDYTKRLEELTGVLDIGALLKTPVRQLSLGQRMRCELAASLLHDPRYSFWMSRP
jgi:ABC-2 type transport system ATP-binding protein